MEFGGLGGILGGREIDYSDPFEAVVERTMGNTIRDNREVAIDVWSALSNVTWKHQNGDVAAYSFRAAADLVAAIRGDGENYLDFYCLGPSATVSTCIAEALSKEGWTYTIND